MLICGFVVKEKEGVVSKNNVMFSYSIARMCLTWKLSFGQHSRTMWINRSLFWMHYAFLLSRYHGWNSFRMSIRPMQPLVVTRQWTSQCSSFLSRSLSSREKFSNWLWNLAPPLRHKSVHVAILIDIALDCPQLLAWQMDRADMVAALNAVYACAAASHLLFAASTHFIWRDLWVLDTLASDSHRRINWHQDDMRLTGPQGRRGCRGAL